MHRGRKIPLNKPLWCESLSLVMSRLLLNTGFICDTWKKKKNGIAEMHRGVRV